MNNFVSQLLKYASSMINTYLLHILDLDIHLDSLNIHQSQCDTGCYYIELDTILNSFYHTGLVDIL